MILFIVLGALAASGITGVSIYLAKKKKGPIETPGVPLRWPANKLPLLVAPSMSNERLEAAIKDACDRWNRSIGQLYFVTVDPIPGVPKEQRTAGILFVDPYIMGDTESRPHTALRFNEKHEIVAAPIAVPLDVTDQKLRQILVHELGHTLGLPHSSDSFSVMFERAIQSATQIRPTDLDAVRKRYS